MLHSVSGVWENQNMSLEHLAELAYIVLLYIHIEDAHKNKGKTRKY